MSRRAIIADPAQIKRAPPSRRPSNGTQAFQSTEVGGEAVIYSSLMLASLMSSLVVLISASRKACNSA